MVICTVSIQQKWQANVHGDSLPFGEFITKLMFPVTLNQADVSDAWNYPSCVAPHMEKHCHAMNWDIQGHGSHERPWQKATIQVSNYWHNWEWTGNEAYANGGETSPVVWILQSHNDWQNPDHFAHDASFAWRRVASATGAVFDAPCEINTVLTNDCDMDSLHTALDCNVYHIRHHVWCRIQSKYIMQRGS